MKNLKIQSRDAHGKGGMRTEGTGFALAVNGEEIILPSHPRGGPPGPSSLPSLSDEMGKFGSHSSHDDEDVVGTSGKVWGHECPVGPFCQRSQVRGTKILYEHRRWAAFSLIPRLALHFLSFLPGFRRIHVTCTPSPSHRKQ